MSDGTVRHHTPARPLTQCQPAPHPSTDLNVEHGCGVDLDAVLFGEHLRHLHLVLLLHLLYGAHEAGVLHQRLQLLQLLQVDDPVLADLLQTSGEIG